jgi:hypothetical protein
MVVRIRLGKGRPVTRKRGKNRHLAAALGALLIPACLMAYVLGFWRVASDMGITGEFGIKGTFSHWQLWMATAVALHVLATILNRYGRGGDLEIPSVLTPHFLPLHAPDEKVDVREASSR